MLWNVPRANPWAFAAGLLGIVVTLIIKAESLTLTIICAVSYLLIVLGLFLPDLDEDDEE